VVVTAGPWGDLYSLHYCALPSPRHLCSSQSTKWKLNFFLYCKACSLLSLSLSHVIVWQARYTQTHIKVTTRIATFEQVDQVARATESIWTNRNVKKAVNLKGRYRQDEGNCNKMYLTGMSVAESRRALQRTVTVTIYSETCIRRNRMGPKIFSTLDKFPHYTK
jgi:hypothetical protein